MKLSWQWLQEFVTLEAEAAEVGEKLTLHTAELEETIDVSAPFNQVFVAQLVSHTKVEGSDKLHIGQFNCGDQGQKQIVFGLVHPLTDGEIVPVALAGARLASGINIEDTEIQGHKSQGMVCDNKELGFKNEALLRFTDQKLIGKPLSQAVRALGDTLFDIDNKSLTHRPDLMGHRGFARELATIFNTNLVLPEPVVSLPDTAPFVVEIKTDGCRRFCGLPIHDITVEPSTIEAQLRLESLEVKAISNFVDITNLIMLEFGQPMHVFDADRIEGKVVVRQAQEGEKLVALDGNEYELTAEDMVVADEQKALSIAGIMGGLESSVTSETKNVFLEVANWDPVRIRKTAQRLGIRTESSMRYEKSLAPEKCQRAILAAAELALECCPQAAISAGLTDVFPSPQARVAVALDPAQVCRMAGVEIADKFMKDTLYSLGFKVDDTKIPWQVEVPFFRSTKDVAIPEDLAEEIIRMHGFENIASHLPTLPVSPPAENHLRTLHWRTRDWWSTNRFLELVNYSFVNASDSALSGETQYTEIENPLSDEYQFLRRSLVSNTLRPLESELRTHGQLQFFEIGRTYHPTNDVLPTEKEELLLLTAKLDGKKENDDFFALKQQIATWLQSLGLPALESTPLEQTKPYQHPAKAASLSVAGRSIGTLTVLHPQWLPHKGASVVLAELDMQTILELSQTDVQEYVKLNPFPSVRRDLSIVLPERVLMSDIEVLAGKASDLLVDLELFDEYRDAQKLGPELKNLAFHLSFRSRAATLTDEQVEAEFASIVDALKQGLGAQLRMEFDNAKNA